MKMNMTRFARSFAAALFVAGIAMALPAQESETPSAPPSAENPGSFGMGLLFGAVTLEGNVYNSVQLTPDFEIGDFGIALDLEFRFTMKDGVFQVYAQDWYFPEGGTVSDYLNLYLSKFEYVRYGRPTDPLYIHFGALPGVNLGTGYIVGGYTNNNLRPETKLFGGEFIFDGALVDFPYLGVDVFTSNFSRLDVIGARLYGRPLAFSSSGLINRLEIGVTGAWDTNAFAYAKDADNSNFLDRSAGTDSPYGTSMKPAWIQAYGVDIIEPIISHPVASLALFGDFVVQNPAQPKTGGMVGFGGRLIGLITYGAQLRISGDGFQPVLFDRSYDLQKVDRYMIYNGDLESPASMGYQGSLGFALLQNGLVFNTSIEGPFKAPTHPASTHPMQYPHLKASFTLAEGVLPYVDFSFWYEKKGIDSAQSLISAENALIGGKMNVRLQSAVVTWITDVKYNPATPADPWKVSTSINAGVNF